MWNVHDQGEMFCLIPEFSFRTSHCLNIKLDDANNIQSLAKDCMATTYDGFVNTVKFTFRKSN